MKINAKIYWERNFQEKFIDGKYSRIHEWDFNENLKFKASASPDIVPIPYSDPSLLDPEEAFLASISSCHMLLFLSIAARKKIIIHSYLDYPEGVMTKNDRNKLFVSSITLNPKITFVDTDPDINTIMEMHNQAHDNCFLANSVITKIEINY